MSNSKTEKIPASGMAEVLISLDGEDVSNSDVKATFNESTKTWSFVFTRADIEDLFDNLRTLEKEVISKLRMEIVINGQRI